MSGIFIIFCVCLNYLVWGSDDANTLCKTTELLEEIQSLKSFVLVDSRMIKQIQTNIMKDLQNQKEIMESNQQRLETALKGVLQDMNKLFGNETQSIKEGLHDLQEENKALKGVLQDLKRDFGNETQSINEDNKDLQEEYYQKISQNQKEIIDQIQGLKTDFLDVLAEFKSLKNFTQSQDGQIQQCPTTTDPVPPTSTPFSRHGSSSPTDCSDIFAGGQSKSGTYEIFPTRNQRNKSLDVFCDMEDGGGWTAFLLRDAAAKHVDFNRNWSDYKEYFGSADQEYWIGNENLHALTSHRNYEVKWEAKDGEGRSTWEGWNSFSVASEENGYRLTLGGLDQRSTVDEDYGFGNNNGMKFSTYDKDNDRNGDFHCAERYKGGWWYSLCSYIFPTGIHGKKWPEGVYVSFWSKEDYSERYATWLQFKIRPSK